MNAAEEPIALGLFLELFGAALAAALIAGLVCPLVGCFLYVRRTAFWGIALPQLGATGVAFGFAILPWWLTHIGLGGLDLEHALGSHHALINYHLAWASIFTAGGLALFWYAGKRGGSEASRVAACFAIASAATLLLVQRSPAGGQYLEGMLQGEVLAIGVHELETIALAYGLIALAFAWRWRELVSIGFDREGALVLGLPVARLEALLLAMIGLAIAIGVLIVGPILLFGLLVVPPLGARALARSMAGMFGWSAALGALAVVLGSAAAWQLDLPLGAAVVACAALEVAAAQLAARRK
jgi:manganese/iron transport system permease protein